MQQHIAMVDPDKPFTTFESYGETWKQRIYKMVKTTKETVASQWSVWAAPVLLISLLGYNVYTNQQQSARLDAFKIESDKQHDLLIEMKTLNQVDKELKMQEKIDKKLDKDLEDVYRRNMQGKMDKLELIVRGQYPKNLKEE